ncbi:MAG: hypothetical protein IJ523_12245 [Succinivibrionaceae bacterium]|nr:hypothetical protein [Succinivibrionaceae bacterium]
MGQMDVVFETAQAADFMVASPPTIPGFGSNYVQILPLFTQEVSTAELSKNIARKNTEFFNGHNMVSDVAAFSAYDLSAVDEVVRNLASLTKKLEAKTVEHSAALTVNTAFAHHYEGLGYDDYVRGRRSTSSVSLESWLGRLKKEFSDLNDDIATLQNSLARLIIAAYATEDYSAAGGLSIYLPLTESNVINGYFDTAFAQKSGMGEYLKKLYRKQKELKEASKAPETTAVEVGNVRVKDGADPEEDRSKIIDRVPYLAPLSGASIRFEVKGENILYSAINQLSVCGDSKTTYLDYSQLVVDLQRRHRLKDDINNDARDIMPRYADGGNVFVREATGQKYAVVHGHRVHDVTVFRNSLDFGVITVFAVYHDPLQGSDTEVMLEYSDGGLKMSDLKTGRQLAYQSNGTLRFGRLPMDRKGNSYVSRMDGDGNPKFEYSDPVPLSAYSLALENLSDDCRVTYSVQASNIWGRQSLSAAPDFLEVRNDPKRLAMMALAKSDLKSLYTRYAAGRYATTAGSGLELLPLTQPMELTEKESFTNIGMKFEASGWRGADGSHGYFEILASDSRYVPLTLKMNLADDRKRDFVFRDNVSSFQVFQKSTGDSRVLYLVGLGSGTRFALYPMKDQNAQALQGTWISDTHKWIFDGDRVVFEYFGNRDELQKGRFEGTYRIRDNQLILEGDFQPELKNMFFLCDRQGESLRLKGYGPHLFSSRKALSAGNMTLEDFRKKLQGIWRTLKAGSDAAMTVTKIENSDNLLFSFVSGGKKAWGFGKVGDGAIDLLYSTGQSKILNFSYDGRRLKFAPESSEPWIFEKEAANN